MKDTGFSVPEAKLDRLATCYWKDAATGKLVFDEARGGRFARPPISSSQAPADWYRRSMIIKGRHDRERLPSRVSVGLMTTDQITPQQKAALDFFPGFWDSRGWGSD